MIRFSIRPVRDSDLDDLFLLATSSSGGMTNLPVDRGKLNKIIEESLESFDIRNKMDNPKYMFALEDLQENKVIGVSAIHVVHNILDKFKVFTQNKEQLILEDKLIMNNYLEITEPYNSYTEICGLFLHHDYRSLGIGSYLSRVRLLFMKIFPERVINPIIAEMRGSLDTNGEAPFWNGLIGHFVNLSFSEANTKRSLIGHDFANSIMPKYPIYLNLVSKKEQKVIGKPFVATKPAMQMLLKEGFHKTGYFDLFDAGPILEADLTSIDTVKKSNEFTVVYIKDKILGKNKLVANASIDFRSCVCDIEIKNNEVILSKEAASLLRLDLGSKIFVNEI